MWHLAGKWVVPSHKKQVICLVGHSSAGWFYSQWGHSSLCYLWLLSYFSTDLACTRFLHIICFNFWDTRWDLCRVNLICFQVVTPCHPFMVWYILHQVAASLSKHWKACWVISFPTTGLFFMWSSMFWIHRSVSNWLIGLENTSSSPFILYWVQGFWGEIREIERDTHNTNNGFEKTDFICGCRKNIKQMTAHKRRI